MRREKIRAIRAEHSVIMEQKVPSAVFFAALILVLLLFAGCAEQQSGNSYLNQAPSSGTENSVPLDGAVKTVSVPDKALTRLPVGMGAPLWFDESGGVHYRYHQNRLAEVVLCSYDPEAETILARRNIDYSPACSLPILIASPGSEPRYVCSVGNSMDESGNIAGVCFVRSDLFTGETTYFPVDLKNTEGVSWAEVFPLGAAAEFVAFTVVFDTVTEAREYRIDLYSTETGEVRRLIESAVSTEPGGPPETGKYFLADISEGRIYLLAAALEAPEDDPTVEIYGSDGDRLETVRFAGNTPVGIFSAVQQFHVFGDGAIVCLKLGSGCAQFRYDEAAKEYALYARFYELLEPIRTDSCNLAVSAEILYFTESNSGGEVKSLFAYFPESGTAVRLEFPQFEPGMIFQVNPAGDVQISGVVAGTEFLDPEDPDRWVCCLLRAEDIEDLLSDDK